MKFAIAAAATLFFSGNSFSGNNVAYAVGNCAPDALEFSETMALKVEKLGSVPARNTDAFSYNMAAMDNFDGNVIYFLDQNNGLIFSYDASTSETKTIFDMATSPIPAGLTLDWAYGPASQTYRVKAMTQGSSSDEVIVVFTSSTLPSGWSAPDSSLPPPDAYGRWVCKPDSAGGMVWWSDIYRPGVIPDCFDGNQGAPSFVGYDSFYKYKLVNGELTDPIPFFVSEHTVLPGHLGGGVATMDDGRILWSVGDCTVFGSEGAYAPQLDHESCGKILLIDPAEKGKFSIVAKGVRNSQQMRIYSSKQGKAPKRERRNLKKGKKSSKSAKNGKSYVAFMEIGGVTAEEVNAVSIDELLDSSEMTNFGWGRSIVDGKAREGTFYVNAGIVGVLGTEPSCAENAPIGEAGFTQPWIQFGRTAEDFFYGISSLALPPTGPGNKLELVWSEFNTGKILGTDGMFVEGAPPVTGYKLKLYDAEENYLENGLNDLVKEELGEVGYYRGDPRLFHFPDGHIGVLIERTGAFYKLTEMTPV